MILILQMVTGIVVLMGVVNAIGFGYSVLKRRVKLRHGAQSEARSGKPLAKIDREKLKLLLNHVGITQMVVQSYGELKDGLLWLANLDERNRTQREIVYSLETNPTLNSVKSRLERLYKTYEQVRFGSKNIRTEEAECFVDDLDRVYGTLHEAR